MTAKRIVLGTLAGALTLFAWETVSNTAIPWHAPTMKAFADSNAVVQAITANAAGNGMYVDARGITAAVALLPDLASRESLLPIMLGRQLALDLIVAAVLLLTFMRLPRVATTQYAAATASLAFAVAASVFVSDWNWYGFGAGWTVVNLLDRTIGYALLGLVLGALINKWSTRSRTDEWGGVRTSGSMSRPAATPTASPRQ